MDETLSRRLLDLGVPAELHEPEALASLIPPEYSAAPGASPELVAELLAALVSRGLVSVSGTAAPEAARRAHRRHLCWFYRTPDEHLELASACAAAAAAAGERAFWVLPGWLSPERALSALPPELRDGKAVRLLSAAEAGLAAASGSAEPEAAAAFWHARLKEALHDGLSGALAVIDGTELAASAAWRDAERLEGALDERLSGLPFTAMCAYSLEKAPAMRLAGLLGSHRAGLARRGSRWDELPHGAGSASVLTLLQQAAR